MRKHVWGLLIVTFIASIFASFGLIGSSQKEKTACAFTATQRPFTEEVIYDSDNQITTYNRVYQNIGDGYGKITKGFLAPSGYYLQFEPIWESRQVKSEIVNAITDILSADRQNGYEGELDGTFKLFFKSGVSKEQATITFETYDEYDSSLAEYDDSGNTLEIDDLIVRNYNGYSDGTTFSSFPYKLFSIDPFLIKEVYKETDVLSYVEIELSIYKDKNYFNELKTYSLHFDLPTTRLTPVADGSLLNLNCEYMVNSEMDYQPIVDVNCEVVTQFASENQAEEGLTVYEYEVESMSGDVPSSGIWLLTIDDRMEIPMEDRYMMISDLPEEPFTLQVSFSFETRDGESITLKSNLITIRKYALDFKIDNTLDRTIGFDVEHLYSLVFDNHKTDVVFTSVEWNYSERESSEGFYNDCFHGNEVLFKVPSVFSDESSGWSNKTPSELMLEINVSGKIDEHFSFTYNLTSEITALEQAPVRVIPQYDISFNVKDADVAILGGSEFNVEANIERLVGDENFDISLTVSGNGATVLQSTQNTAVLLPICVGTIVLFAKAESPTVGMITKTITLSVLESTCENTEINLTDKFVKTGSSLNATVSIGGYSEFLNYSPLWRVEYTHDKISNTVDYKTIAQNEISLLSTTKGDYTFYIVNTQDEVICSKIKNVSDIDMNQLIRTIMPFMTILMLVGVIAVSLLRQKISSEKTIDNSLDQFANRLNKKAEDFSSGKDFRVKKFKTAIHSILRTNTNLLSHISDLNNEADGQYQTAWIHLKMVEKIAKSALGCANKITQQQAAMIFSFLSNNYVEKAAGICKTIREALATYASQKRQVETVIESQNKKPLHHSKKKTEDDYLKMLTSFYSKGDEEGNEEDEQN